MKPYLRIYIVAFLIAFPIGFFWGKRDSYSTDNVIEYVKKNTIIQNVHKKVNLKDTCSTYLLFRNKQNDFYYLYSLDSHKVESDNWEKSSSTRLFNKNLIDNTLILVGGGGGLYTLFNLPRLITTIAETKESKSKAFVQILVSILGTLSGFGLGYLLAYREDLDIKDSEVVNLVASNEQWKNNLVFDIWKDKVNLLKNYYVGVSDTDSLKKVNLSSIRFLENQFAIRKSKNLSYLPTSLEFYEMERYVRILNKKNNIEAPASVFGLIRYDDEE